MSKQIIVFEDGEVTEKIDFSGGYIITVNNNHDKGKLKHIRKLDNGDFDGRHWIKNFFYKPKAYALAQKYEEINHLQKCKVIERIIFLEDMEWEPGENSKKIKAMDIKKANKHFSSITGFYYVMEIKNYYIERMQKEQILIALYSELRRISKTGEIVEPNVVQWSNIIATCGVGCLETQSMVPNLLNLDQWDELPGVEMQMGLFGDRPLRAVK